MATLATIVAANASKVDPFWDGSATRRWPGQAIAAAERGKRTAKKRSKQNRLAAKAEKQNRLSSQRMALGLAG